MSETSTLIGYQGKTIDRETLALVPTPLATDTHRPIPHHETVTALVETLGFRHIGVVRDEYAVIGPRLISRGNAATTALGAAQASTLQWGRD